MSWSKKKLSRRRWRLQFLVEQLLLAKSCTWTVTHPSQIPDTLFLLPVSCATLFLSNLRLYVSDLTPVAPYNQLSLDWNGASWSFWRVGPQILNFYSPVDDFSTLERCVMFQRRTPSSPEGGNVAACLSNMMSSSRLNQCLWLLYLSMKTWLISLVVFFFNVYIFNLLTFIFMD